MCCFPRFPTSSSSFSLLFRKMNISALMIRYLCCSLYLSVPLSPICFLFCLLSYFLYLYLFLRLFTIPDFISVSVFASVFVSSRSLPCIGGSRFIYRLSLFRANQARTAQPKLNLPRSAADEHQLRDPHINLFGGHAFYRLLALPSSAPIRVPVR